MSNSFMTLILILAPMFIGFLLPKNQRLNQISETVLNYIVFLILLIIGIELSTIDNLSQKIHTMALYLPTLIALNVGFGIVALWCYDIYKHQKNALTQKPIHLQNNLSHIKTSLIQVACLTIGFLVGKYINHNYLPPKISITILLMLLLFLVGILLKNSHIKMKDALMNKQGIIISLVYITAVLASGIIFALMFDLPINKGLALSAGFGWYSLSGTIMTDTFGAFWGSIALLNDLSRELLALFFIPYMARFSPSASIGLAGVTGLDFTLPSLQNALGNGFLPLIVSFGVITNIASPVLMVFFSTLGQP